MIFISLLKSNESLYLNKNESIKNGSNDIFNYFITYLIPILSMDIQDNISLIINFLIFIIIGLLYIKSDNLHLNPLLILINYEIFSIQDNIILTKMSKNELKKRIAEFGFIKVRKIADNIYIERKVIN